MKIVYAYLRQWVHCLTHLHRAETWWIDGRVTGVGCECGRYFYGRSLLPFVKAHAKDCRVTKVEYEDG